MISSGVSGNAVDCEVVVTHKDGNILLSMDYLFSIVCRRKTRLATSGPQLLKLLDSSPNIRLLVIGPSDDNNMLVDLIKQISSRPTPPFILAIDTVGRSEDRVSMYAAGANDVIRSPFSMAELCMRLMARNILCLEPSVGIGRGNIKNWETEALIARHAKLTPAEAKIAHVLLEHRGRVVSRNEIAVQVSGHPWMLGSRKFDVHISHLRKKFNVAFGERCTLKTIRTIGYLLEIDDQLL